MKDLFIFVGKIFAHIEGHITHSIRNQSGSQPGYPILCSQNGKNLGVMPDQGNQIAVSSMSADDPGIIPGKTDLRHKINNGRNPADHLDIAIQKIDQLPCTAVEAHIAGKGNGYGTVLWMCLDILHDLITAVLMENHLPRPLYGICHTLCTDQKLRLIKGLLSFQSQGFFRTHADAYKRNPL